MPNLTNLSKALEPGNPQNSLDRNQELNKAIVDLQTTPIDQRNWAELGLLIPSGRRPVNLVVPVPKDLAPSSYFSQEQFNNRQDRSVEQLKDIGMSPGKNRIYLVETFDQKYEINGVLVSHGKMTAGVINQSTKDQAQIVEVPWERGNEPSYSNAIKNVMVMECERQGKTPQTVDLRHITVNLSQSNPEENPPKEVVNAINALTSRGASVVIAMGNNELNSMRKGIKGALFVDGAKDFIGDPPNPNPIPSGLYKNWGNLFNQNTRSAEIFEPSSRSVIAPSVVKTRITANGDLEIFNAQSAKGWSKFIDKKDTRPISTVVQSKGALEGLTAQRYVSLKDLEAFNGWVVLASREVKFQGGENAPLLRAKIAHECQTRFGKNAVISYSQVVSNPYNDDAKLLIESRIPEGQDTKKVVFSVEGLVLGSLQAYVESDGKLKSILPNRSLSPGTSFAAPAAAGFEAIRKQEQLNLADNDKLNSKPR